MGTIQAAPVASARTPVPIKATANTRKCQRVPTKEGTRGGGLIRARPLEANGVSRQAASVMLVSAALFLLMRNNVYLQELSEGFGRSIKL